MEKVVVAVDPYDVEDKASIFSVNYRNYWLHAGLLRHHE